MRPMFDSLYGQEPIKAYLEKALREHRLPHALLFAGLSGVGKALFAKHLAAHLLQSNLERIEAGNHPDFSLIRPEGKSGVHAIDTLRAMMDAAHISPYEASHKVFVIEHAERMQPASANALLKTLEEPPADTTFILLCHSIQEMLPTILSRCAILHFQPLPETLIASFLEKRGLPLHLAKMAQGSLGRALELASCPELETYRQSLFRLLAHAAPYLDVSGELEKIEKGLEEKKEEDPVRFSQNAEQLFIYLWMWIRDQALRKIDPHSPQLFFPDEPMQSLEISSLLKFEKALEEALFAFRRHFKFSTCLERLFQVFSSLR